MASLKIVVSFFVTIFCTTAFAQKMAVLSGKVSQKVNQLPVEGDAYLLSLKDSSVVKYTSVTEGKFLFDGVIVGNYFLQIVAAGVESYLQPLDLYTEKNIAIELAPQTKSLLDVTVLATRKVFSNKNGNIKINVEGSPFASLSNPVELLGKLPQLRIGPTGETVTVVGKGSPLIYINNQQVTMIQLTALAVSDIKSIEIIKNPSAKYEANGRTVILVTRKTIRQDTIKTDISQTLTYRKYFTNRFAVSTSYRKNKLELKSNLQYNQIKNWERNAYDFSITSQAVRSSYDVTSITTRPQFILGQDVFYRLDTSSYLSVNATARLQNEQYPILTNSYLKKGADEEQVYTDSRNNQYRAFTTSVLNYNKDFKKITAQLFAGAQFSTYRRINNSDIFNAYNNDPEVLGQERYQRNSIDAFTAKMDLAKNLKHNAKLEAGFNVASTSSNSITNIKNFNPAGGDSSIYKYNEHNTAAYTQFTGKISKADYSAGVRIEQTNVLSGPVAGALLVDKKNLQFFPKINVDVPLDSLQTLSISYAKTTDRPDFSKVTNQSTYINPFFEWANNINLNPTITHELSGTYQHKNYSAALNLYRANGPVYPDFAYNAALVTLRRTDRNYDSEAGATVTLTIPIHYKILKSTNILMGNISKVKDANAVAEKATPYLYAYSNNRFNLSKGYVLSVSGWIYTGANEGIFQRASIYTVDTSLSKQFFNKLTCTVSAHNLFDSLNSGERFTINDIASNGSYYNTRDFSLGFKYSLGKTMESNFKKKDVDENLNRIN